MMKAFLLLLLLFVLLALIAPAQTPAAADGQTSPGVEVVKFNWSKERLNWERDPFAGVIENFDDARVRMRNEKRIEEAKRGGNTSEVDRLKREARADDALIATRHRTKPARYAFAYKASFRNHGPLAVKAVDWDYVFYDAATGEEIGRHQFTSEEKIGPGKSRELSVFIASPPTRTVSVYALNDKERESVRGQVMLVRVEYADGSVWQSAPPAAPAVR